MKIDADIKSIADLKDYFFVVPDYQREYVWKTDENVSQFLQDISDEYQPGGVEQSNYFIGSTIIVKKENGAFDVVDGQQRLTTIVIALCAVRKILPTLNIGNQNLSELRDHVLGKVKELLYEFDLSQGRHIPRLSLQYAESRNYLGELIAGKEYNGENTPSIKKMKGAYGRVMDFLNGFRNNGDATLINFARYFLLNVQMVIIKPDNLGSALKIFETINERGVGLNAMDLLKNLLFSHAPDDQFESIKQTWREMLQQIDASGDGDRPLRFLRYFLMGRYHNGILREDQIYKWIISDEGKTTVQFRKNPIDFANVLRASAAKYSRFIKATTADDADPEYPNITGIGYLMGKTSRQHLVLLLAVKDNLDKAIVNRLAKNVENLVFYYSVNRTLTKAYEEKFANWAQSLRNIATNDQLNDFLGGDFLVEFRQQQAKFNEQFATKSQGDLNPQYRIKYVLCKLENFVRTKVNFPSLSFSFCQQQQLEHVLPRTSYNIPGDLYPQSFDYDATVQRLGNLTLLEAPINQSINNANDLSSNAWFEVKKVAYLNSNILLTRTFSQIRVGEQTAFNSFAATRLRTFDQWNMTTIAERQEIMRQLMLEVWKVE